jgi:type IV secretion system protein VirB4
MLNLKSFKTKNNSYAEKEIGVSHHIPYLCHWNDSTILLKNKSLMKVVKVSGFSFETADDDDVDIKKNMRNMLFKGMSSGSVELYFHTIRKRTRLSEEEEIEHDPDIIIPLGFFDYMQNKWNQKYHKKQAFSNELYITIIKKADTEGAAIFEHLYNKFFSAYDKENEKQIMKDMSDDLEEITNRVMTTLSNYGTDLLQVEESNGKLFCKITEFLSTIANCGQGGKTMLPSIKLDKYLSKSRYFFGKKSIELRNVEGSKYYGIIAIKEYGPTTYAGAFDGFLQMPFEFVMSQSFNFSNRQVAINKMQLQQNRMIQAEDKAVSQIREISQALDMAMSGDIAFGNHHLTVLVGANNPKALENYLAMCTVEMFNAGLQSCRETINLECSFWGQLPGNSDYIIRKSTINSLNLAGFASQHNYPIGKATGNYWGKSVAVFNTTSGTPFHFNFHVRDVGHTLIIGPTGAGKTVLMNFLCGMAQKFNPRMFFFDKDRGAEIFIRAIGGKYTFLDPSSDCEFNPLLLDDTGENRTFILDWLKILVTSNGEDLTAEDVTTLSQAIEGNYKLDKQDRRLRNIVAFLGMEGPGSLANRIAIWHSNGSHANIFDNQKDSVNLTSYKNFGFEMAELLKDKMCLAPVLLYIFHRINISLDGTPTMIVLDEAWALIDNEVFAPKIKDWLKVLRKQNAFVVFATQSVEDAAKSRISDTLIQQTATQIFLPNLKATTIYRTSFMLSAREYQLIKTTDPSTRYFLIKQGTDAIIARIDLSGMDDIMLVLSARTETVALLDDIIKKYGEDPKTWLPVFYQEANKLIQKNKK